MSWAVERHVGSASSFHAREMPDPVVRAVWWFEVDQPAVVLGSTQKPEIVDEARAAAAGVDVVRRRSGGGAVWLEPGHVTWVDVLVPNGDLWWEDDVGRAALWLGRMWVAALGDLGLTDVVVHDGAMVRTDWSDLICFAGVAPGEVLRGGAKMVGISQRRTRAGARFQCAVLHRWDPLPLIDLVAPSPGDRRPMSVALAGAGAGVGSISSAALVAALLARLRSG